MTAVWREHRLQNAPVQDAPYVLSWRTCKCKDSVITQLPSHRAAARESGISLLPRDHPSAAISCAHAPPLVAAKGGGRSRRVRPVNQTPTAATPRRPPPPPTPRGHHRLQPLPPPPPATHCRRPTPLPPPSPPLPLLSSGRQDHRAAWHGHTPKAATTVMVRRPRPTGAYPYVCTAGGGEGDRGGERRRRAQRQPVVVPLPSLPAAATHSLPKRPPGDGGPAWRRLLQSVGRLARRLAVGGSARAAARARPCAPRAPPSVTSTAAASSEFL